MKITVEFSLEELKDIQRYTGEIENGPAIRSMVIDALMLKRRETIARKFVSGEYSAELSGYEAGRELDRKKAKDRAALWTDK